ncbi:MAG: hypothetical protein FGM24_09865 [Candidatus Kapabacteria bacterium]|nr:hypothetical protein [Candidatus Kapabacteria bacterium]
MQATFFTDVPKKLIDLLPRIRFAALTPREAQQALSDLEAYVSTVSVIKPRRDMSAKTKTVTLPDTVPVQAIEVINRYDYSRVSTVMIAMAMPIIEGQLRSRGLL